MKFMHKRPRPVSIKLFISTEKSLDLRKYMQYQNVFD